MSVEQPVFYVAAGPSGGGKTSTLYDKNLDSFNIDDRAAAINGGSYQNIPPQDRNEAFQELVLFKDRHLASGQSFGIETTLRDPWALKMIDEAHAAGFSVRVNYIAANDPQVHIDRVIERGERGGHSASPSKLLEIYDKSTEHSSQLVERAANGTIERLQIFDSTTHLTPAVPTLIIENGKVEYLAPQSPAWLEKTLQKTEYEVPALKTALDSGQSLSPEIQQPGPPDTQHMIPLEKLLPNETPQFTWVREQADGTQSYQHKETQGWLHIDSQGHLRNTQGQEVTREVALDGAMNPEQRAILEKALSGEAQNFTWKREQTDHTQSYQHTEATGWLHIDPQGQFHNNLGQTVNRETALDNALHPSQDKAIATGKIGDSGAGFGL